MLKSGKSIKKMKTNNNLLNRLLVTNNKRSFSKYTTKTNLNTIDASFSKNNYSSNIKNSKNNIIDVKTKQNINKNILDIKIKYQNNSLVRSKNNNLSKKKIILNNKYRIPSNNYDKALMISKKNNLEFIDNIVNNKINVSRNNRMSIFNNKTVLNPYKNFNSLNNIISSNNNYIKNYTIIHYSSKNIIPKSRKNNIEKIKNKNFEKITIFKNESLELKSVYTNINNLSKNKFIKDKIFQCIIFTI